MIFRVTYDSALTTPTQAHAQDQYALTHMDTYSRLLNHASLLKLTPRLLYASPDHHQPWVAKAWESVRGDTVKHSHPQGLAIFLQKANMHAHTHTSLSCAYSDSEAKHNFMCVI